MIVHARLAVLALLTLHSMGVGCSTSHNNVECDELTVSQKRIVRELIAQFDQQPHGSLPDNVRTIPEIRKHLEGKPPGVQILTCYEYGDFVIFALRISEQQKSSDDAALFNTIVLDKRRREFAVNLATKS